MWRIYDTKNHPVSVKRLLKLIYKFNNNYITNIFLKLKIRVTGSKSTCCRSMET